MAQYAGGICHTKLNVPDFKACFLREQSMAMDRSTTGAIYTLPAKERYDAGTPIARKYDAGTLMAATLARHFNGNSKSDICCRSCNLLTLRLICCYVIPR